MIPPVDWWDWLKKIYKIEEDAHVRCVEMVSLVVIETGMVAGIGLHVVTRL